MKEVEVRGVSIFPVLLDSLFSSHRYLVLVSCFTDFPVGRDKSEERSLENRSKFVKAREAKRYL